MIIDLFFAIKSHRGGALIKTRKSWLVPEDASNVEALLLAERKGAIKGFADSLKAFPFNEIRQLDLGRDVVEQFLVLLGER